MRCLNILWPLASFSCANYTKFGEEINAINAKNEYTHYGRQQRWISKPFTHG